MRELKVITLYQPWATLIAIKAKRIETRSWPTEYRGRLGIHASAERKYIDPRSKHYVCGKEPFCSVLTEYFNKYLPLLRVLPRGAIITTCELEACLKIPDRIPSWISDQEAAFGNYTPGRFMWMLGEDVIQLKEPIPAKGHQRLWNWELPDGCEWNEDVDR